MAPFDHVAGFDPPSPGSASTPRVETLAALLGRVFGTGFAQHMAPTAVRQFSFNYKLLGLAVILEVAVATLQFLGGRLMAAEYGGADPIARDMMMLAPMLYFVAEMTRVPLGLAFRLHPSKILRAFLLAFAVASAAITVKSASQIGDLMYRPRLYQVGDAQRDLAQQQALEQAQAKKLAAANTARHSAEEQVVAAHRSVDDARLRVAELPPPACSTVVWYDREGRERRDRRCTTPPKTQPLLDALKAAEDKHKAAITTAREISASWSELVAQQPAIENATAEARAKLDRAIMQSQVHSFSGMIFRKSAEQVSEEEIYTFLQIFVFVPAVVVSLAGLVLTCASVQRLAPTHIRLNRRVAKEIRAYLAR
jgi:hypothetical protein